MPSHLRNGRDLSGKQRRRNVEAGLPNTTRQRTFQCVEGEPPVPRTNSKEPARTKHRSYPDGDQLQGHISSVKVRDVNPSSPASRSFDGTANRSAVNKGPGNDYRPGEYPPVEPSSYRRQQTSRDVHQYVLLPEVHVRRSQEERRSSSHDSGFEPSNLESRTNASNSERRRNDERVRELASTSGDGHHVPEGTSAKDRISTATQASTPTPIHQTRSPSPQEDVAMVHRDPTPVQATAHSASSISSAHQITQNHAQRAVQNAMNASNYVNQTAQQAPHQNLVPNYAPAPTFAQNQNSATNDVPVQNFVSNYAMPSQQNHNQATYEHPRPPQHQQGLPGTSHQAGPTSINRPVHRTRRDRFHYNRNESAAPQPHPPPQQRPAPYPVQHQPGGNSGGSRRRRRNPQPQDNSARVLEVGDVFLRAERILGRMQRVQGRKNAQNRNHPNQHYHQ
ncbi:hypothetical protein H4Q26_007027 [Puccinia striiformis f. sp. tritici PST-130]|nr:hypothetical protein H4Q26_007027 [Puccinia striiformis f. sp. tritici PST-130]